MRIGKKEEKAGWERRKKKQTGINELYRRSKNKNRKQKKSNGKSQWDFKIKRNKSIKQENKSYSKRNKWTNTLIPRNSFTIKKKQIK